ncbi:MAG: peptidoglycan DD-metalloendopeptidase family protein [Bifidobacteriaceae bacterium]|jgi:murein DD-endopeptidase MepM/ murein hydrolase activator NlpD|nr:peptidoglycan DD-metalloendopeptidase family protein [Bifidobacteriaceae bacterium]
MAAGLVALGCAGPVFAAGGGGSPSPSASASSSASLKQQYQDNLDKIEQQKSQLSDVKSSLSDAYVALQQTDAKLPLAQNALATANADFTKKKQGYDAVTAKLQAAKGEQAQIQGQIDGAEAQVRQARDQIAAIARQDVTSPGATSTNLMLLLGTESMSDLTGRYIASEAITRTRDQALATARQTAAVGRNRKARLDAVAAKIVTLQSQAKSALDQADSAKTAAEAAKDQLDQLQAQQQAQAQTLEQQKKEAQAQLDETQHQNDKISAELKALAAKEKAATPDGGPAVTSGTFGAPLSSLTVTSPFGWRMHPILHTMRLHTGVDLEASCGQPIYATAGGTVIRNYYNVAWGNRTEISHGVMDGHSFVSTYNHQKALGYVHVGETVTKGQVIGYVGTTGWSTGCHLHFEIYVDGSPENPMQYIE